MGIIYLKPVYASPVETTLCLVTLTYIPRFSTGGLRNTWLPPRDYYTPSSINHTKIIISYSLSQLAAKVCTIQVYQPALWMS